MSEADTSDTDPRPDPDQGRILQIVTTIIVALVLGTLCAILFIKPEVLDISDLGEKEAKAVTR